MSESGVNVTLEDAIAAIQLLLAQQGPVGGPSNADQIWILTAGFLVFFMHAGFTMLESGSVRHKNAVNIMFKNIGTVTISGIAYYLWGYAFAYGTDNAGEDTFRFIGSGNYALSSIDNFERHLWFFQWTFAATAATIVSGAVAGRAALSGYFVIAFWMTSFVYPVVSHWIWATGGWASALNDPEDSLFGFCGVIDFAGSGVVHMTGGVAALYGAIMLGPRLGRFGPEGKPIPAHNMMSVTLGTLILWFGWYGFNVGSTLALNGPLAAKAAVTTTLSPSASAVTAIVLSRTLFGNYDLTMVLNSILGGLVAITAGCTVVEDWAAIIIGFIACFVYVGWSKLMQKLKIDDPVDAIAVHGACGLWGLLAVGIFATQNNIDLAYGKDCSDNGLLFAGQLVGGMAIIGWVTLMTIPAFYLLKLVGIWRVPEEMEHEGLDNSEHGGTKAFIGPDSTHQAEESTAKEAGSVPATEKQEVAKA